MSNGDVTIVCRYSSFVFQFHGFLLHILRHILTTTHAAQKNQCIYIYRPGHLRRPIALAPLQAVLKRWRDVTNYSPKLFSKANFLSFKSTFPLFLFFIAQLNTTRRTVYCSPGKSFTARPVYMYIYIFFWLLYF